MNAALMETMSHRPGAAGPGAAAAGAGGAGAVGYAGLHDPLSYVGFEHSLVASRVPVPVGMYMSAADTAYYQSSQVGLAEGASALCRHSGFQQFTCLTPPHPCAWFG